LGFMDAPFIAALQLETRFLGENWFLLSMHFLLVPYHHPAAGGALIQPNIREGGLGGGLVRGVRNQVF
jgi:hypothetical protein